MKRERKVRAKPKTLTLNDLAEAKRIVEFWENLQRETDAHLRAVAEYVAPTKPKMGKRRG